MPTTTGIATEFIQFSRTTNATVTDSDGKIKWASHNLLLNSESFDTASWVNDGKATVTANSVASPIGTTTADTLADTAVTDIHYAYQLTGTGVLSGTPYTFGVFVRPNTLDYVTVGLTNASSGVDYAVAVFRLSTSTVQTTGVSGTGYSIVGTPTISAVGGNWYYCSITAIPGTTRPFLAAIVGLNKTGIISGAAGGLQSYLGDGSSIYVWGAHLYRSDLAMQPNTSAYPFYNPTTPKNLLGFTETFSDSSWTKAGLLAFGSGSVADAAVAPNGLQTADLLVEDTSTGSHNINRTFTCVSNTPYTWSAYVRPAGRTIVRFVNQATAVIYQVEFTLSGSGTSTNISGSGTATITPLSGGWYRISATSTATAGGTGYWQLNLCDVAGNVSYTGNGTSGIYLWGAQLSVSASLDAYAPIYGAAVTSAAYYGPRRDFNGSTLACNGLLVEEQRTNFFTNSNDPAAGTGTTITASAATSPDGTQSAYRIAKTDATTPRYIARNTISMTTVGGRAYAVSAWFKYDGYNTTVSLEYNDSANWDLSWIAQFTVADTGVTVLSAVGCTQSVQNVGNGWYRAIVTFTAGAAPTVTSNPVVLTRITGASGVTVLGYGGQIEEIATFPSSYIPTIGATATRNVDVATVSAQAFPYNATEGALVVNVKKDFLGGDSVSSALYLTSSSNTMELFFNSADSRLYAATGGALQVNLIDSGKVVAGATTKTGFAYAANNYALSTNGGTVLPATTATVPPVATLGIGSRGSGLPFRGWIRQITYIPRRISNAELQTRTT